MTFSLRTVLHQHTHRLAFTLFALIVLLMVADVLVDFHEGQSWQHVVSELVIVGLALLGALLFFRHVIEGVRQELSALNVDLQRAEAEARKWRLQSQSLLQGLGLEIQKQFTHWGLSKAESEVGLLILKGLSHQEIAGLRGASERTVREQARAVYRKAGLGGKAELSAFFLEDLWLPAADAISEANR